MKTAGGALRILRREQAGVGILELGGRLDASLDPALMGLLAELSESGIRRVILDCAGLEYLGSGGVSVMIAVLDDLRAQGGDIKLSGVTPQATQVLDRLGVSRLIQRFATVGEAVEAFRTPIEDFLSKGALGTFVASAAGGVFHAEGCTAARKIRDSVRYISKRTARQAGLRPCRRCCEPAESSG